MRFPFVKDSIPFICVTFISFIFFALAGFAILSLISILLLLFFIIFFRDPERTTPHLKDAIIAPADGKIISIERDKDIEGKRFQKISIFMSIWDVHVNRIPFGGMVKDIEYRPGRFLTAYKDEASESNEQNIVDIESHNGHRIRVVQVAGIFARRIVCWLKRGEIVKAGQRLGVIRFGSRVDLFLPEHSEIIRQVGEKVKAGRDIIGYLR